MERLSKVFVYGTLKSTEYNHYWFSLNQKGHYKFITRAKTVDRFPLVMEKVVDCTSPRLIDNSGYGYNVEGEVYEVNRVILDDLDYFHNFPVDFYRRQCLIKTGPKTVIAAWVYFASNRSQKDYTTNSKYHTRFNTTNWDMYQLN